MNLRPVWWVSAALALGLIAYALWPETEAPRPQDVREVPAEAVGGSDSQGPLDAAIPEDEDESQVLARRAEQLGESRRSELRQLDATRKPFPHDVRMDDYKASLWSDIQANPPEFEVPGDPTLDAETAYRIYMYYGMCSIAPRTAQQVDRSLAQLAERAERSSRRRLAGLEYRAERTANLYELCQSIPPDVDCRMEAVIWMTEAVRLGHEIAQVQFYEKALGFLMRADPWFGGPPLILERPGLISEFKATASQALTRAVEKGHPEAFLAMSEAILDGAVYPRDPVLALAYAHAAEHEAMKNHIILHELEEHKYLISQFLDREQILEAEELSRQLRFGTG